MTSLVGLSRRVIWSSIPADPVGVAFREGGVHKQWLGPRVAIERSWVDGPPGVLDVDEPAVLEHLRVDNPELRLDREFLKTSGFVGGGGRVACISHGGSARS
jgi:hypothetical protein